MVQNEINKSLAAGISAKGYTCEQISEIQDIVRDIRVVPFDKFSEEVSKHREAEQASLESKEGLERLSSENAAVRQDKAALKSELKTTAVRHAAETKLMQAGARNPNLVLKILNLEKIQQSDDGSFAGLDEQIEALKSSDAYLFHPTETPDTPDTSSPVIDEFRRQSWFFDQMPRREITNVAYGGGTITYRYYRAANPPSAATRPYYTEVDVPDTGKTSEETNIAILRTAVDMDVDLMRFGGIEDEWNSQIKHAMLDLSDLFNEMVIRGDSAVPCVKSDHTVGPASFDGLDKIIRKELLYVWDTPLDLTGLDLMVVDDETKQTQTNMCHGTISKMMVRLRKLRPRPTFILGNDALISALSALGRRTGIYQAQKNDFGDFIDQINGISLIRMGKRWGRNEEIIPVRKTKTKCRVNPDGKGTTLETTAYVGSFGDLAIMGLQLPGDLVKFRFPDMNTSGYVKKVDIEMRIGMAVMSRYACGMFEHVCIGHSP